MHSSRQAVPNSITHKILRSLLYLLVWLILFPVIWFVAPVSITYVFTERYVFSPPNQPSAARLVILIPTSGPYQEVDTPDLSWDGLSTAVSYPGVDAYRLEGTLPAGLATEASISYRVTLRQGPVRWSETVREEWRLPQANVESDAPEIRSATDRLSGDSGIPDAYWIFDFTAGSLSWPTGTRENTPPSALEALRTGVGGCEEFANLMTAVARAAGIPARTVAGLALPSVSPPFLPVNAVWSHPGGAHAWVEIFAAGEWIPADPSWASALPPPLRWLWYGRTDGGRLSYGETAELERIYREQEAWARALNTQAYAAMSAPLHFAASADAAGLIITPGVTMVKTWDGRWAAVVAAFLLWAAGMILFERRVFAIPRDTEASTGGEFNGSESTEGRSTGQEAPAG